MSREDVVRRAEELFRDGHACSEAVMLAVGEHAIPDFDRRLVRAATPWGGGIAYGGSVCGSLAAGVMLLGLAYGRESVDQRPNEAIRRTRRLRKAFEAEFGTLLCGELTGGKFRKAGDTCLQTVRFAAGEVLDALTGQGAD